MNKKKAGGERSEKIKKLSCWCGGTELEQFSSSYLKCTICQTLINTMLGKYDRTELDKKQAEFYGKPYWVDYQKKELGFPDINERARQDLPGRCLYWLKTILKYRLPDARLLELGSSHGGFVALLGWAGYKAKGLEINQWVIDFARRAYNVNLLAGSLESHELSRGSLDIIVLMDVIEHVSDPSGVLSQCAKLLSADGIIILQTPRYLEGADYEQLQAAESPFLNHLHENEHLYLFSRKAMVKLLQQINLKHIAFEPAFFAHYDMFLVAGKKPLQVNSPRKIEQVLSKSPEGRMVLALFDLDGPLRDTQKKLAQAETERTVHLSRIEECETRLETSDTESRKRYAQIKELTALLRESESDRDKRMQQILTLQEKLTSVAGESEERYYQIQELTKLLQKSETESKKRFSQIESLRKTLDETEHDSRSRYDQIEQLTAQLRESESDRSERLRQIETLREQLDRVAAESLERHQQIETLARIIKEIEEDRTAKQKQIEQLSAWLKESEADRASRLQQMESLGRRLDEVDRENRQRYVQIEKLQALLRESEAERLQSIVRIQELTKKQE
jgi:2-polyprenyl-3-methyl-5-hydroxy-6-metoxy-1,4-benzoquinol methylase